MGERAGRERRWDPGNIENNWFGRKLVTKSGGDQEGIMGSKDQEYGKEKDIVLRICQFKLYTAVEKSVI